MLSKDEIIGWLRESSEERLAELWQGADETRARTVGTDVHFRGLLEISNYCMRRCGYCGISVYNTDLERYRMSEEEILDCAGKAVMLGYGTMVLQAGEDYGMDTQWLASIVRSIKAKFPLAVTLSLGERSHDELVRWRKAGADRYLLRFETSDPELYRAIHPPLMKDGNRDRFAILRELRELGYEVGSGIMIGIPGQTYDVLARDLLTFREFDLDMIGVGPFIPHPATPLGSMPLPDGPDQVRSSELMTYKVVALTRIICPEANIPSTTALATLNKRAGRELGLQRGANVVMPNLTPPKYRVLYEIYPDKACVNETAEFCSQCLERRVEAIGRTVGRGPGGRRNRRDLRQE